VWFLLYPTTDRRITRGLLVRAAAAGCRVLVLTVDTPVMGNRETHGDWLARMLAGGARAANLEGLRVDEPILDPTMTWDMISWLRDHGSMKIVIKGIVTGEDAEICRQRGVDGIVVSNHGGRQEESGRGTLECLPEVLSGAGSELPVMIDGGIRRGTDVFKALALGAKAVAVGRPYVYGLAAMGSAGVELALEILRGELVRAMQLAGATSLGGLEPKFVPERGPQVTHEEIGGA
jgi:isopentenyl diphosphate isomerase/L-lactate dehydrogenase-like FMN-dependent dehydrogenase